MKDDDRAPNGTADDVDRDDAEHAAELREALDARTDATAELLLAAVAPRELDADLHEQILARALGLSDEVGEDTVEAATPSERRGAEALRSALEPAARRGAHPLADLARAVRLAHDPAPIAELRNEALLSPALKHAGARGRSTVLAGLATLAVAAAALGIYFGKSPAGEPTPSAALVQEAPAFVPGMVEVHSTSELFAPEDFPREGGTTARSDRMSSARNADLRTNRFARWGVE